MRQPSHTFFFDTSIVTLFFALHFNTTILVLALLFTLLFSTSSTNDVSVASPESAEAKRVSHFKEERAHCVSETAEQQEEQLSRETELGVKPRQPNNG